MWSPAEVCEMRFDSQKVCSSLAELWRERFDPRKVYSRLAELLRESVLNNANVKEA